MKEEPPLVKAIYYNIKKVIIKKKKKIENG